MIRDDLKKAWEERRPCVVTARFMSFLAQEIMQKYMRSSNGRFVIDGALVELAGEDGSKILRDNRIQFKLNIISLN